MAAVFLLPLVLGVLAALFLPYVMNYLETDRCLDAGGKFNHDTETCEREHPSR